jgi:hypothetical protein
MQNSKLVNLLKTFSADEIKEFDRFIQSPYFTTGLKVSPKVLARFYKMLMRFHPDFKGKNFSKEIIFNKLYPCRKYKDEIMRNLLSVTMRLGEEYLTIRGIETRNGVKSRYLLRGLREKKINNEFEKSYTQITAAFDKNPYDSESYLMKHEIELERAHFLLNNNMQSKARDIIFRQMEHLFCYFLNFVTNNIYLSAASRESFNTKYRVDLTEEFMKFFDYKSFTASVKTADREIYNAIEYEYLKTTMHLNKSESSFYSLKSLIKKYPEFFNKETKLSLYYKLLAFCINKMDMEYIKFLREEFILFKEILEGDLELEKEANGFFPLHHFRNIILTATELNEGKWLEGFLKKYTGYITPELQDEINEFGKAFLLYSTNRFEEALEHTIKINYRHHVIQTDIIILRLKIFYQLNYVEESLYLIDSFKHFLVNNKSFSGEQKTVYMNFIKYLNKLIKERISNIATDIQYLKNKIAGDLKVHSKHWLLEKINEIK